MLIVTRPDTSNPPPEFIGVVGCERIAPVTDYQFVMAAWCGESVTTTLRGDLRWTEPTCGLLARLVSTPGKSGRLQYKHA